MTGDADKSSSKRRGLHLFSKKSGRPSSSFSHSQILPTRSGATTPPDIPAMPSLPFGAPNDLPPDARAGSISPESVFGGAEQPDHYEPPDELANNHHHQRPIDNGQDVPGSYDLNPPPPSMSSSNVEMLAGRFFSVDHLNLILRDQTLNRKFSNFITHYKPSFRPILDEYQESQKALAAIEYANTVAESIHPSSRRPPYNAAQLDQRFEARAQDAVEELVGDALPAYVTHRLTQVVTDTLVKEITGQSTPLMREMIPSLAEVYCVTDPSIPDNPIVYASEEFYNTTQYGKEYVIGRNCRFLQGPKSSTATVKRLIDALAAGQEITETILNYRRDGTPFMNLLLIAPLYDNKGTVRYFLGCQIDVSSLVEGGRGLDSFEKLLSRDRTDSRFGGRNDRRPAEVLSELGAMFNEEELNVIKGHAARISQEAGRGSPAQRSGRQGRKIIGMDDDEAQVDKALWPSPSLGPSGRLPGVYQNYMLVRPYPSLRITFTSPALRIPGLLQTKFLDRIGGPTHVREGILDALAHGTSVTAKISWLVGEQDHSGRSVGQGKQRWVHCTPLLGSDEKVGVWMIVMVESEEITGSLNSRDRRVQGSESNAPGSPRGYGAQDSRFTGGKLYQDYLRREGRSDVGSQPSRQSSARDREGKMSDQHFKDF